MSDKRFPSRREVIGLGLGAFVIASFPGARRLLGGERRLIRRSVPVMGTVAELAVVDGGLRDERRATRWAHRGLEAAVAELRRVEGLMTRFRPDSDVGRANLDAARRPVAVSTETAAVIRAGLAWARASDGAFDPALGRAVALWDVQHRTSPPGEEAGPAGASGARWRWRRAGACPWSASTIRTCPWTWAGSPRGTAWTPPSGPSRTSGSSTAW